MKHALITYLDALWETNDVLHALRYGDAELITDDPKLLYRLTLLAEDVNRQIGLAEHLSEVLASGLEVLQSIYNNQLQIMNNRMALIMTYLTVLGTAVLVPNTLATIMGSSAFNLQSNDIGWYVTAGGFDLCYTILAYWWVKNREELPKWSDRRIGIDERLPNAMQEAALAELTVGRQSVRRCWTGQTKLWKRSLARAKSRGWHAHPSPCHDKRYCQEGNCPRIVAVT
jgi:hypothetical protein